MKKILKPTVFETSHRDILPVSCWLFSQKAKFCISFSQGSNENGNLDAKNQEVL